MAERDLTQLLLQASPELQPGEYVFVVVESPAGIPPEDIVMSFREVEGTTLILPKAVADAHGLVYDFTAAWITMKVHSALDAVGFTAAFAAALAEEHISCNVVAGYYHDHLFVPVADGERAVVRLGRLG